MHMGYYGAEVICQLERWGPWSAFPSSLHHNFFAGRNTLCSTFRAFEAFQKTCAKADLASKLRHSVTVVQQI